MKVIKYGITHIEGGDKARDQVIAAKQTAESIANALDSFDYNGKDPNLVLARTAALEASLAAVLKATGKTPWVSLRSLVTPTDEFAASLDALYLRRNGDQIDLKGHIINGAAFTTWTAVTKTPLPKMFRPNQSAIIGADANSSAIRTFEFAPNGHIRAYSSVASGSWWALMGDRYFTDEPLP